MAAPAYRSSTTVTGTGVGSVTVTKPAGVVTGDVLLMFLHANKGGAALTSISEPTGWTALAEAVSHPADSGQGFGVYYRIADGTEPASWSVAFSASTDVGIICAAYSGAATVAPGIHAMARGATTTDIPSPGANTTLPETRVVRVWAAGGSTTVSTPAGVTSRNEIQSVASVDAAMRLADEVVAVPGAYPERGATAGKISAVEGFSVDLTPANVAPNAPTLIAPANASSVDLAVGYTFSAGFSDPNAGDTMASYAFRRKISGAASYEYWNVTTGAWQGTEVFNALTVANNTTFSVTFAAGKWTNGTIYQWSMATRDQVGATSTYATDSTVTSGAAPVVTVTAPTGTVTDAVRPLVTWSYADAENDPQATYNVKVFSQAQYSAVGFSPDTTVPAAGLSSGEVPSSTVRQWQMTTDLVNTQTYRAYVRVSQGNGGQYSTWAFSTFTMNLTPPNTPTLTAVYEMAANRVSLAIQGHDTGPVFTPTNTYFAVEFSDDGGATWGTVRGASSIAPDPLDAASLYDYEIPAGGTRRYRALKKAMV